MTLMARDALRIPPPLAKRENVRVVESDLDDAPHWTPYLEGVRCVIHLAGRAHVFDRDPRVAEQAFQLTNVEATRGLAHAAAEAGVARFVFASSIKVNGEASHGSPFRFDDPPRPEDAYGRSKWAAEQELERIGAEHGMETVMVRPPLVYGPGVKANFARLVRWVEKGLPLPLASIDNRRSLVGLDNLCSLFERCATRPEPTRGVFLVADGEPISTPDLLRAVGLALHRPARVLPFPPGVLASGLRALGRGTLWQRLGGSLEVDIQPTCDYLGWRPECSMAEELARTVKSGDLGQ